MINPGMHDLVGGIFHLVYVVEGGIASSHGIEAKEKIEALLGRL